MNPPATDHFTHGVTLAYRTYGQGPLPLLAFHGFGRTGADFEVLEETLGTRCTLYAFDLHFHGESPAYHHRVDEPFAPEEIAAYFAAFMDSLGTARAALLGYSLGGRVALGLLEHLPERISQAFLVAPDGLKPRPWYRTLLTTRLGRLAYGRFVEQPGAVRATIRLLGALRLMDGRMRRFLLDQTASHAKRQLVRDVWLSYRLLEPDLARMAAGVLKEGIPVHLFFGARDKVIPPKLGWRLRQHAADRVTQRDLPYGHLLLKPELGKAIAELLPAPTTA